MKSHASLSAWAAGSVLSLLLLVVVIAVVGRLDGSAARAVDVATLILSALALALILRTAIASDKTERELAASRADREEADRRAEEGVDRHRALSQRLRHLLATGPAMVFDLSPPPELRVSHMSDNAVRITGYSPEEMINDPGLFFSRLHPDDIPVIELAARKMVEEGFARQDIRFRHKDGAYRRLHGEVQRVDVSAVPSGFVGWWMDVTDIVQANEAREAAREAAEAASRAKSDFLANMSHEIRTPMNGVMGMLDLALDGDLPAEQREYLEIARLSAESLLTVINDILDFSKIEAGRLALDEIPFDLPAMLEETLSTLALRAHHKSLELALEVDPNVPAAVVGDPGRIRQVIVNLVGNAIKFTERGEVVVRVIGDSAAADTVDLHVAVCDTGIGIAPEKLAAIFEPFTQADTSTTRRFGGTGLGLAISTKLVELMRGRIWAESKPGVGSTMHFTVPLKRTELPAAAPVGVDLRGVPALVVDDNATNRSILQGLLTRWGMKPTVVDGGLAGLALLRSESAGRNRFSLLIVDAQMPGMDGFAFVQRVREHQEWGEPAIMMLSSATFHEDVRRCREVGIDVYLTKPVRATELRESIARLLAGRGVSPDERHQQRSTHPATAGLPPGLRVLLAEDNPVNQQLALALLRKHGAAVTLAADGREAVKAFESESFDVILMDVQMPELDGLEASRLIRSREAPGARVPIIALTARAMAGDREACLAAGMDSYVPKPIRAAELLNAINQALGLPSDGLRHPTGRGSQRFAVAPREGPAIDLGDFREITGDDADLMGQMLQAFRADAPRHVTRITEGIAASDAGMVRDAAHTLKGAASAIGARAMRELADELEAAGRSGDLASTGPAFTALAPEMRRVVAAIDDLLAGELATERAD
jgi:PAS domain S-box-containing protein